jgi:ubiquinone/menaquinone biosynthesis C-methylase UbiE
MNRRPHFPYLCSKDFALVSATIVPGAFPTSGAMSFKDHFSGHASDYKVFRPAYPPELFVFLASLVPVDELVWDCATGNGQAAIDLAGHFSRVFATDASAEQIRHAEPHPRVEYAVAPAERCPLPDQSVNLVTVAQALHWFDMSSFYAEVRRVSRPGGYLAVWTYNLMTIDAALNPILERLQIDYVGRYWPPERELVDAAYRTVPFPFEEVPIPRFSMHTEWDFNRVMGYMNTWSSTKAFIRAHGFNPLERLADEFLAAWGEPSKTKNVQWQFYTRVGRIG